MGLNIFDTVLLWRALDAYLWIERNEEANRSDRFVIKRLLNSFNMN